MTDPIDRKIVNLKSYLPEDESERCGYGIFSLAKGHPFEPACKKHDRYFDDKENKIPTPGRRAADEELLKDMLSIAKIRGSFILKIEAYVMYGIARSVGRLFW